MTLQANKLFIQLLVAVITYLLEHSPGMELC